MSLQIQAGRKMGRLQVPRQVDYPGCRQHHPRQLQRGHLDRNLHAQEDAGRDV